MAHSVTSRMKLMTKLMKMGVRTVVRRALGIKPPPPVFPGRVPDFFLAGAARSGTTSMWQYLRQHPQLYLPEALEAKEPSFFSNGYGYKNPAAYCALYAGAGPHQLIGDCSTPYLTSPESAERIRESVPEARILIQLRNPADRAASLHGWMLENGYESIESFEHALAAENKRRTDPDFRLNHGQYFYNFLYFESGLYTEQVNRYFQVFGRDRVLVQIFEEIMTAPEAAAQRAFEFLGVDPSFRPAVEVHNARRAKLEQAPENRAQLLQRYAVEISKLERLLGRELSSLWK